MRDLLFTSYLFFYNLFIQNLVLVHERGITYNPRIGMEQAKAYQIRNQAYQQRDQ